MKLPSNLLVFVSRNSELFVFLLLTSFTVTEVATQNKCMTERYRRTITQDCKVCVLPNQPVETDPILPCKRNDGGDDSVDENCPSQGCCDSLLVFDCGQTSSAMQGHFSRIRITTRNGTDCKRNGTCFQYFTAQDNGTSVSPSLTTGVSTAANGIDPSASDSPTTTKGIDPSASDSPKGIKVLIGVATAAVIGLLVVLIIIGCILLRRSKARDESGHVVHKNQAYSDNPRQLPEPNDEESVYNPTYVSADGSGITSANGDDLKRDHDQSEANPDNSELVYNVAYASIDSPDNTSSQKNDIVPIKQEGIVDPQYFQVA